MSVRRRAPREAFSVWPDPLELSEMPDLEWGAAPAAANGPGELAPDNVRSETSAPGVAVGDAGWLPWEREQAGVALPVRTRSRRVPIVVAVAGVSAVGAGLLSFSALQQRPPRLRPAARAGGPGPAHAAAKLWKPAPIAVGRHRSRRAPRTAPAAAPRRTPAPESVRRQPAHLAGPPPRPAASSVPLASPPRRPAPAALGAPPPAISGAEFAFEARG